jgi:hypothetical protein
MAFYGACSDVGFFLVFLLEHGRYGNPDFKQVFLTAFYWI